LRFEKEIETLDLFRLLLLAYCMEGKKLKNNKEEVTITLDNVCMVKSLFQSF